VSVPCAEVLDRMLILGRAHLLAVLGKYQARCNAARPHHCIAQQSYGSSSWRSRAMHANKPRLTTDRGRRRRRPPQRKAVKRARAARTADLRPPASSSIRAASTTSPAHKSVLS